MESRENEHDVEGSREPAADDPAASTMAETQTTGSPRLVDVLLRRPHALLDVLDGPGSRSLLARLSALAIGGYLLYGIVVGSFSGGAQWWAAPAKILIGTAFTAAICFPSLYIFVCLSGAQARLSQVAALLLGLLALNAVFLAGFAPVAWVFSESSTLVSFIGSIHLLVWICSTIASCRVLNAGLKRWKAARTGLTGFWFVVLVLTSLQMATTLRPIVGSSPALLDGDRKFFLQHWGETIAAEFSKT